MRKPSSTPHLLWSWPLVPKRLGTSELRYFYWALLFSNSHHSLTHSPRFPLESNSDFIKICSIADGHQLKISGWSGTPFAVHPAPCVTLLALSFYWLSGYCKLNPLSPRHSVAHASLPFHPFSAPAKLLPPLHQQSGVRTALECAGLLSVWPLMEG